MTLLIEASKEDKVVLGKIPYMHYSLRFQKDTNKIWALLNLDSKVNTMTPAYALKLDFRVRHTNIRANKIDGPIFEAFKMVLASIQMGDKLRRAQFFQKTFLLANISMEVIFEILFLTLSNSDIQFAMKKPT